MAHVAAPPGAEGGSQERRPVSDLCLLRSCLRAQVRSLFLKVSKPSFLESAPHPQHTLRSLLALLCFVSAMSIFQARHRRTQNPSRVQYRSVRRGSTSGVASPGIAYVVRGACAGGLVTKSPNLWQQAPPADHLRSSASHPKKKDVPAPTGSLGSQSVAAA